MTILDVPYINDLAKYPRWSSLTLLVLSCFIYLIGLAYYRLYLAPVSKIPGPKLAALTFWYEFYYDVIKDGQYQKHIETLHDKYGPVIRINPCELHVMDPDFYDVLYGSGAKPRDKWSWHYDAWGVPDSMFATIKHERHRKRRAVLNPSFSKKSVAKLEISITECVENMCRRFREWQQTQKPLRVRTCYAALTMDVITEYCLANSADSLNRPDLDQNWVDLMDSLVQTGPLMRQFGWLLWTMNSMPEWLTLKFAPSFASFFKVRNNIRNQVAAIRNTPPEELNDDTSTIIHRILQSDLPPEEKTLDRITSEAQTVINAGQITTADTLERATFELLTCPEALAKLKEELASAIPNSNQVPSLQKLEQLPYLSAVISETLRIATPIPMRLQRIATDESFSVAGYKIPAGVPIGMSSRPMHYQTPYFLDSEKFVPERWLVPESERLKLEKYFVPFGKGTRICIGMHLAEAELYIALATIFRRFDLELFETTLADVKHCRDYLNSLPYKGSERLRVIVKQ